MGPASDFLARPEANVSADEAGGRRGPKRSSGPMMAKADFLAAGTGGGLFGQRGRGLRFGSFGRREQRAIFCQSRLDVEFLAGEA